MADNILKKFFEPRSVALVGATSTPGFGFGIPIFWKKHGWLDKAFLINPKGGELHGKKVLRSVEELPDGVDLAVVIVPAARVKEVLGQLGRKGVRAVVVESAGFAETGDAGRKMHDEFLEVARGFGMRLLGPNCVGVVNTANRFATIEVIDSGIQPGRAAIIAQSGVFGNILLDHLPDAGLKISKVATLGNKADLDETDFLAYFAEDENTSVILLYQEGVRDGQRFLNGLKAVVAKKPVVVLKSGRTPFGTRATLSHTGSLSGADQIYDGAYRQAGAVRANSLEEMIDLAKILSSQPKIPGKRVGLLTTSGSLGALTSDALFREGLELAEWSPETVEKLLKTMPGYLNIKNPLDVGPSGVYKEALEIIITDPNPDAFIMIPVIPYAAIENFRSFGLNGKSYFGDWQALKQKAPGKPVITILLGQKEWLEELKELCGETVSYVTSPDAVAKALRALSS